MPVDELKLGEAASQYERILKSFAGEPPILDVIHLGLGTDGHTASLFPGDSALKERKTCVAVTDEHAGFRRMTLTLPVLNSARSVTWLVTGAAKAAVLSRLVEGSLDAPAGLVRRESAVVFAERMPGGGFAA
jgi:6-phosphogluconolactonase